MNPRFPATLPVLLAALVACSAAQPPRAATVEMPAAAANPDPWYRAGDAALRAALAAPRRGERARNVILFIGDGMSLDTVTAARIFAGQAQGGSGEDHVLSFERLPHTALMKTYTTDLQVPDSAGTATAMLSGVKTKAGVVGVNDEVVLGHCASLERARVPNFLEQMERRGKATGVVSTARITHATPAAAYAHVVHRDWEVDAVIPPSERACTDIAAQLVGFDAGDGIEVMLGGGRAAFLPLQRADEEYPDQPGARLDGRDLIAEWLAGAGPGARYVWNREQFEAVDFSSVSRVLGLFEPSHMEFEADRAAARGEPSLAAMTRAAVTRLSRDPDGFFLLVEGGRIDHAHHAGNAARALHDTVAFDAAVQAALDAVDLDETLIVVTADHGHVMSMSGYPRRGNPILGKVVTSGLLAPEAPQLARDLNGKPMTTLSYANGPGHRPAGRPDLSDVDTTDLEYLQEALVPLESETHSGTDVIVYADGPGARLFHGVREQNYVYHVMRYAAGL